MVWVGDEVVDQGDRPAEHGDEPVPSRTGAPERHEQGGALIVAMGSAGRGRGRARPGPRLVVAYDSHQPESQRLVGVGGRTQCVRQTVLEHVVERVDETGQRSDLQQSLGPAGAANPSLASRAAGEVNLVEEDPGIGSTTGYRRGR